MAFGRDGTQRGHDQFDGAGFLHWHKNGNWCARRPLSDKPQLWELLSVERSQGGVWGLIEPILHCGGMGVMAECGCPPEALKRHCVRAMKEIEEIAGKAGMPKGYMAFMDTDLKTLTQLHPELYHAVEEIGLDYFISSALPGRNRILYQGKSMIAFNLTPRNVCSGSPYVRMSVMEDIVECERTAPGWIMGGARLAWSSHLRPYIWNRGSKFMEVVNWMVQGETINVLPHTISRYIRILKKWGTLNNVYDKAFERGLRRILYQNKGARNCPAVCQLLQNGVGDDAGLRGKRKELRFYGRYPCHVAAGQRDAASSVYEHGGC